MLLDTKRIDIMTSYICFLITLHWNGQLIRCALKANGDNFPEDNDIREYPMEPENKKILYDLLPEHVKVHATIVEVSEIFEVCEVI